MTERSLRISLVTGSFPPMRCGIGDYTANLAEALAGLGDTSVSVLTDVAAGRSREHRGALIAPIVTGWRFADARAIFRFLGEWKPDVVHMQFPTQGYGRRVFPWTLPWLLRRGGHSIVQTWHEYFRRPLECIRNLPNAIVGGGLVAVRPDYRDHLPNWYRWAVDRKEFRFIANSSTIPRLKLSLEERSAIRKRLAPAGKRLVAFFGFAYPEKGLHQLLEIAKPETDHLVLIGWFTPEDPYQQGLFRSLQAPPWQGRVTLTGTLEAGDAARALASVDAIVLPFVSGGGDWNSSLHAALGQGTFVLTTSRDRNGDDPDQNAYFARPSDLQELRAALRTYGGRRGGEKPDDRIERWRSIAEAHRELYLRVLSN